MGEDIDEIDCSHTYNDVENGFVAWYRVVVQDFKFFVVEFFDFGTH